MSSEREGLFVRVPVKLRMLVNAELKRSGLSITELILTLLTKWVTGEIDI